MSVMEAGTLDTSRLLMQAFEIGDMIISSTEVAEYLHWKNEVERSAEAQELIRQLAQKKELFEECQRFGHFHPDYHTALEQVNAIQEKLDQCVPVRNFKQVEDRLDDLLHTVSETIAFSVSETIKVPGNNPLPAGGCSTGGACSGKCS